MPCPLSQSDSLIQIVDINSDTKWQTVQIQISWLLQKPTDLDLHCLQRQSISGLCRTRVKLTLPFSLFQWDFWENKWADLSKYLSNYIRTQNLDNSKLTWSYSDEPGYSGHPRNNSAMTQPRDHMSIASQNGRPSRISGALKIKKFNFLKLFSGDNRFSPNSYILNYNADLENKVKVSKIYSKTCPNDISTQIWWKSASLLTHSSLKR